VPQSAAAAYSDEFSALATGLATPRRRYAVLAHRVGGLAVVPKKQLPPLLRLWYQNCGHRADLHTSEQADR
jgi:hypothetical protein